MQVSLAITRPAYPRTDAVRLGALATLVASYALLFSARGWFGFADESDNFLGGYLIAHGETLYRNYFSHHMPLPYYLAAIPAWLGVSNPIDFRVFNSLVVLGVWTFIITRFRNRIDSAVLCTLVLTIGLGFPRFFGHMFLSDTFEAYAILLLVLYVYAFPSLEWRLADQLVIALAIFAAITSSLMSVYPLGVLMAYYAIRKAPRWKSAGPFAAASGEARLVCIVAAPFVLLAVALFAGGLINDFLQDAFVFNQVYYSKYALASDPLSIVKLILRSDYGYVRNNLHPLAWQTIDGFALFANVVALVLLLRQRRAGFAIAFLAAAAISRGRGLTFHDQTYYLLSFFSVALVCIACWRLVSK